MSQLDLLETPASPATVELRPYQSEAVSAVFSDFDRVRSTMVIHATGLGKTVVLSEVAKRINATGGRVLVLAHAIVLVDQASAELRKHGISVQIERADQRAEHGGIGKSKAVVGTVQTIQGRRLRAWDPDEFALVIVDECHHAVSRQYRELLNYFTGAKVLGVSATSDRADGTAMANVFQSVAHQMDIMDGIEQGHLCRVMFKTVQTDFDPKRLKEVAGDIDMGSVSKELVRSGVLSQAASTLAELRGKRTVCYLPSVAAAKALSVELSARSVRTAHVDATTPQNQRESIYRAFRDGEVEVLTNVALLIEGWNMPSLDAVAILAPTKSRARLVQMIGRCTRKHPGKEYATVYDFCHGRLKKGRLCSPADALAGKMLDDDLASDVRDGDILDEIRSAQERAEQKARLAEESARALQADRERRAALLAAQALVRKQSAVYSTSEHAASDLLGRAFAKLGAASVESTPEAEEARRRRDGVATVKQAAVLQRYGLSANMPRAIADFAMGRITAGGWKLSPADRAEVARRMELHGQPAR